MAKCSLCGGTLDENKRCTFCGLDNTKNDEQYGAIMNRIDCDGKPLTHVHEHTYPRTKNASKSNEKGIKVNMIATVIVLVVALVGFLRGMLSDVEEAYVDEEWTSGVEITYDAYLDAGQYEIGKDNIPGGIYTIELDEGSWGTVEIQEMIGDTFSTRASYTLDSENLSIVEDVYLEENDVLSISPEIVVYIYSTDTE